MSETSGTSTSTTTDAQNADGSATGSQDTGQQQVAAAAQQTTPEWDGKVESLPEPVQKMIRELRQENGNRRTATQTAEQRQQELIRAVAKAAGIELPGDEQPDPAKLTEQLSAARAGERDRSAELVVWQNAQTLGVDPRAVTDSRAFERAIKDLDPSDAAAFEAAVKKAAQDAAANNPKLKAAQAAGASGAEFTGGSGDSAAQSGTPQERARAYYGSAAANR